MSWIDRVLRKKKAVSGNTPVVSEQMAAENPEPDHARIVVPDVAENEEYVSNVLADEEGRSCGHCIHFNHKAGQQFLFDKFNGSLPRMLKTLKMESIGGHLNTKKIGMCEQWSSSNSEPALMDSRSAPTVAKWWLDQATPHQERDHMEQCPYFRERPPMWRRLFRRG